MFYTYIHATPEGDVFYVGKGKGGRVYSMSDRTIHWKQVVKKHEGLTMKIVAHFETEREAFEHEKELISKYKAEGKELVNLTIGGPGPLGYCLPEEARMLKKQQMTGYKHKNVTCPHCGQQGGETSMKRWHFEKCTGAHPKHKVRPTVFGRRVYLGKEMTKELADTRAKEFYDFVHKEAAVLGRKSYAAIG